MCFCVGSPRPVVGPGRSSPKSADSPFFKHLVAKWEVGRIRFFCSNRGDAPLRFYRQKHQNRRFFLRFSITRLRSNFALINHGSGSISASPRPFLSAHQIPPAPQFRVFSDRRDDGAPLSCAAFAPENHPIGRLFLRAPTSNSEIPEFGADLYYVRPEGVGA